MAAPTKAIGFV